MFLKPSYIGRFAHRLLQEESTLAMPLDLVDPASKMDYFTAATLLTKATNAGTDVSHGPYSFLGELLPQAAGKPGFGFGGGGGCAPNAAASPSASFTATQAMYDMYSCFPGNETSALFYADLPQAFNSNDCAPACSTVGGNYAPFQFWDDQFSSLYGWRSTW